MCDIDPGKWVSDATNAVSSALGTDGSGGGALGTVSDLLGTSGKKGVGLLQDPQSMAIVAAVAAYYGIPADLVAASDVSAAGAAGVIPAATADSMAAAIGTGTAATTDAAAYTGAGLTAGSGTTGLAAGGGAGLAAGSTIGNAASISATAGSIAPGLGVAGAATGMSSLASGLSGAGSLVSGVAGLASLAGLGGQGAASAADPFASQRPQYQAQLSQLMANPNAVMPTMPGYQSGLQATERADAAMGFAGGGRAATDIANFNSTFYNQQQTQLANLAGANAGNTGAAASALSGGAVNQAQLLGTSLNSLAYGASLVGR